MPDLIHLLHNTTPIEVFIGYIVLALILFGAIFWGVFRAFKIIHSYMAVRIQRYVFLGSVAVLLVLTLFQFLDFSHL